MYQSMPQNSLMKMSALLFLLLFPSVLTQVRRCLLDLAPVDISQKSLLHLQSLRRGMAYFTQHPLEGRGMALLHTLHRATSKDALPVSPFSSAPQHPAALGLVSPRWQPLSKLHCVFCTFRFPPDSHFHPYPARGWE